MSAPHPDAYRLLPGSPAPVLLTCEHASEALPDGYAWPAADARLRGTHWAVDLGAAALVEAIHRRAGWPAILANYSRLIADLNRPEGHVDLFRTHADGLPIHLNADLSSEERTRRTERFHRPYHQALHDLVVANPGAAILSIHSFTDLYEGQRRTLEVGVLFDRHEDVAVAMAEDFAVDGVHVALNEPWSGKDGLVYAMDRHAQPAGRRAIELELRQDRLLDAAWRERIAGVIVESVRRRLIA